MARCRRERGRACWVQVPVRWHYERKSQWQSASLVIEFRPLERKLVSHRVRRANLTSAPNSRTLAHLRADPCSQQVLDWLVLKVLGHQVQLSAAPPEPIEDHRHCGFPDTHTSTGVSCLLIQ